MIKVIKGFLAGIAIGILFAPQSGAKTRKKLSKVFTDYKDDAKDYLADAADKVETKAHKAKKAIQQM